MKAVRRHTDCRWVLLYIERWLTAPMQKEDGTIIGREKGTPQGGVISPLLANLFLHYAFDRWMATNFPKLPFCRYADDALIHCRSHKQAIYLCKRLESRLKECGLELHPDPRWSTAKITTENRNMKPSSLTFWAIRFDPDAQKTATAVCLSNLSQRSVDLRQSPSDRRYAVGGYN
jgi:RNA-directed DNA polymerase